MSLAGLAELVLSVAPHTALVESFKTIAGKADANMDFQRDNGKETRGRDLRDLDPKAQPNYTSLEGYVAARVLVEGLRRAGVKLTPGRLVAALEEMRRVDLGGYEISFSARSHDGSRFVDSAVIGADGALKF